jgi:alkyl hydroperoxide reductase subunit F
MLDAPLKSQLGAYLERLQHDVELVASLDNSEVSWQMHELLSEIAALSPRVTARFDGTAERRPSFQVTRAGADMGLSFAAVPLGHEFTSLVLALLHAGGHPPKVEAELIEQIRSLDAELVFEAWMSLTCHNCPDVVQALNLMAALNPRVKHLAIDGVLFQSEVEARQVMAVPAIFLNRQPFASGRMGLSEILAKVDTGAAAVYAARKGIRTGLVAERFGGQTLDTLGIENFISVAHTEGPRFASDLEAHVRTYEVELMKGQRVQALQPATGPGGVESVTLANGAGLEARSVVLAPGASWRNVGVPGEQEYKNRGVAYCPHCDGPPFRGKKVAVIGGGNSGVEAAIDLAGVFVQIGLVPNTEWLKGVVDLNRYGEIVVDARGATSVPGISAAGDATTVPYKQIVVAVGEGSKAALSAFDHLIRTSEPAKALALAA